MKIKREIELYRKGLLFKTEVIFYFIRFVNDQEFEYVKTYEPVIYHDIINRVSTYPKLENDKDWERMIIWGKSSFDREEIILDLKLGVHFIREKLKGR